MCVCVCLADCTLCPPPPIHPFSLRLLCPFPLVQDMMLCMAQTKKELVLFFIITSVGMVLFGSAVFYCEKDEADTGFISIPGWSCVVGNVGAVLLCLTPCVFACMHAQAICKCKMQSTTKRTSAWLSCLWACPHFAPILLKDTTPLPFCVNHANPPASPSSFSFSFLPPPLSLSFSPPPLPSSSPLPRCVQLGSGGQL